MSDNAEILTRLAQRLKDARAAKGLSLDAVAKLSGVSRSMVSQIERSESSPTIATLWNLSRALQVDLGALLDAAPANGAIEVLLAEQAPTISQSNSGWRITILSPPEDAGDCEIYDLLLDPGGALVSQPHAKGARESLTVMSGRMKVLTGEAAADLSQGDTARYRADFAHRIEAIGGPARGILVVRGG